MSTIYPDITVLRNHTTLNIPLGIKQLKNIKLLVTNMDKRIWHISIPERNGQTSIVLKCSKRQRSLIEFNLYKGSISNMEKFLPNTHGVWQQGEWYCIAMEHVNDLSPSEFSKQEVPIIDYVAQLHREFAAANIQADWLPKWTDLNAHNLVDYFTTLLEKSKTDLLCLPTKYRESIHRGIHALPSILERTQTFSQSLIHRSISRNNLKINDSGRLLLLDWEDAQIAPAVLDVVWFLEIKLAVDLKWCAGDDSPRKEAIKTYLKNFPEYKNTIDQESFLREYKIMYVYLFLTSLVWAYFQTGRPPAAEHQFYLETYYAWVKELKLF